jgi:WD40 repeat protein
MFAANVSCCNAAEETAGWGAAKVTKTDLLAGETNHGKFVYSFASTMTRAGCHVAKVERESGKGVFVRRDGRPGKAYEDIAHPVFSPDGSALAYAVRGTGGSFFVVSEREGPRFGEVLPDTFVFSGGGKRHAYLAKRDGRLVAVVDGKVQAEAGGDMVPWLQAPVFSADGTSVGYLEGSRSRKKMRAVVNGKPGETFDGVDLRSLEFSPDGRHFAYGANDLSTGSQWFLVIDGQRRNAFETLGVSFSFSPDGKRFAYTGRRGQQWFVVVNGEPDLPVEGIVDHSLTFSPDSQRVAYAVAKLDTRCYIVVDGKPGPVYDSIGGSQAPGLSPASASGMHDYYLGGLSQGVLFSPDSRRLAYLATRQLIKKTVVLDGKPEGIEMSFMVSGMVFSDDSKRLAYGGRRGNKFFLVVDGEKGVDYDALGYFGFSPDGKHIAYAARKGDKFVIAVDHQERGEYGAVPAGPVFRSDGVLEFLAADRPSLYRIEVRNL